MVLDRSLTLVICTTTTIYPRQYARRSSSLLSSMTGLESDFRTLDGVPGVRFCIVVICGQFLLDSSVCYFLRALALTLCFQAERDSRSVSSTDRCCDGVLLAVRVTFMKISPVFRKVLMEASERWI